MRQFLSEYIEQYRKFSRYGLEYRSDTSKFGAYFSHLSDDEMCCDVKKLLLRILVLCFFENRPLNAQNRQLYIGEKTFHLRQTFDKCGELKNDFCDRVFKPLIFNADCGRAFAAPLNSQDWQMEWLFSGALFSKSEADAEKSVYPQDYFESLFAFLDRYTFSTNELQDEKEGLITPGILSWIFELQLENQELTGAYYTPESVVRFMCRESLTAFLMSSIPSKNHEQLRRFIEKCDVHELGKNKRLAAKVGELLRRVTVCDPAIGCGAFAVGMFRELLKYRMEIEGPKNASKIRTQIVNACLYGADIDADALEITRIRLLFLLMENDVYTCNDVLPNGHLLHGNSLISCFEQTFDVVIGNPPYGVKLDAQEKGIYSERYLYFKGRADIYMAFFELGLNLTHNILCFITPDKWLSKSFALGFREHCMLPMMSRITHLGKGVFQTATVDAVVSLFEKNGSDELCVQACGGENQINASHHVNKAQLKAPWLIDRYFQSEIPAILNELEQFEHCLGEYARCEYAMVSPKDAYQLKLLIGESDNPNEESVKLLTTGLLSKYRNSWGLKRMKYLKMSYQHPVVSIESIRENFGESVIKRVKSPKLIIKGLNLLDCSIDAFGGYMSTVATLNIRSENVDLLKVLSAIINSSLMTSYCRAKYLTSSYCGGLEFTPEMLNNLPVPDLRNLAQWRDIIDLVSEVLSCDYADLDAKWIEEKVLEIDALVCRHYGYGDSITHR